MALTLTVWAQRLSPLFDFFHEFIFTGWVLDQSPLTEVKRKEKRWASSKF